MKYYFIGIKGSGMSSLAMLVKDKGNDVRGSDVEEYIFTEEELKRRGIPILNFNKDNINKEDIVIIGHKFIESDNEEVIKAKEENKWYEYNDFISEFIKEYYSIAISGSHGKTTTTSLIMNVLNEVDDCGCLIGDGSAHIGDNSNYFVFEACEQKEHFMKYSSDIIVINNIDYDHVDYFKTEDDYINAFYKTKLLIGDTSIDSLKEMMLVCKLPVDDVLNVNNKNIYRTIKRVKKINHQAKDILFLNEDDGFKVIKYKYK